MQKINRISPDRSKYLQIVTSIAKSPESLYFIGSLPTERRPTVAIIGARKFTRYGEEVAYKIAFELASRGVVILSGLAIGIDGLAHRATLDAGGTTLAVLGNGLPRIYPSSHQQLADRIIASGGAIISEYEPGRPGMRHQFLERNRIVSGLSDVVLVIEAAARSGTLATVRHALDQGRDVAAVPGNITSPMSEGCNNLIKQGATPVTSVQDVLALLNLSDQYKQASLPLASSAEEAKLIELLASGIRDGHVLQTSSQLDTALYNQTLSMLEITGRIRALGGNQWTLS